MAKFEVFVRNWYKNNKDFPNGLEPHLGKKEHLAFADSEEDARRIAKQYNASHPAGRLSRKAEYTSDI